MSAYAGWCENGHEVREGGFEPFGETVRAACGICGVFATIDAVPEGLRDRAEPYVEYGILEAAPERLVERRFIDLTRATYRLMAYSHSFVVGEVCSAHDQWAPSCSGCPAEVRAARTKAVRMKPAPSLVQVTVTRVD